MHSMQNLIGQTLGQYQIRERIGEGGMATVFKAWQPGLNREVALKVLPPQVADKPGFAERFRREAQAIGNLRHPNILPVYDSGQDKGYSYLAMQYIPQARTLADVMRAGKLDPGQIISLTGQIAAALNQAHEAGVVHRDVKPSNILMDKTWPYLSDFGLAKLIELPSEITGTGVGVGTPAYMSPEQAKGEKIDHRTDIYALGIIVFEMLTGQVPHKAETPLATVMKRITDPLPSPRSLNPAIPLPVEAVLVKALASNPADRFAWAGELATALQAAFSEKAVPSVTPQPAFSAPPLVAPAPAPASRSFGVPDLVIMAALGLVTLCGVSGVFLSFTSNDAGEPNIALLPACIGLALAALTSMGLVGFRRRTVSASAWLALGVLAWFIGLNFLGWGGFALLDPRDSETFTETLGFSMALCFVPGGFLALLGLGLYSYDYWRGKQSERLTTNRAAAAPSRRSDGEAAPARSEPVKSVASSFTGSQAEKLRRAGEYRVRITRLIKQQPGTFADYLGPIISRLDAWEKRLHQLVESLHRIETDSVIQRDFKEVPVAMSRLEAQLKLEINPKLQTEMSQTLAGFQQQQAQLDLLKTVMQRTELDIDETLAAIGAIYSQLQVLSTRDLDRNRAKRLSAEIEEQNHRLNDLLSAMDEVYQSTAGM